MEKPSREELLKALDELFSCLDAWKVQINDLTQAKYGWYLHDNRVLNAFEAAEDVLDRDAKGV